MERPVVQFQILAEDAERLAGFYQQVFGWPADRVTVSDGTGERTGPYWQLGDLGGIAAEGSSLGIVLIVPVDDIAEARAEVLQSGGSELTPANDVVVDGVPLRIALVADPEGNRLGLLQPR